MNSFGYSNHVRRYLLMAALLAHGGMAAAASDRFYLHDATLLKQLHEASAQLTSEAQQASAASMLSNLNAAAEAGRAGITASERTRQQALLLGLSRLSWARVRACALNSDCETNSMDNCTVIVPAIVTSTAKSEDVARAEVDKLTGEIGPLSAQIEQGRKAANAPAPAGDEPKDKTDKLLERLDKLLMADRTGESSDKKSSRKLFDLLSKAKDTDLIRDPDTRRLLTEPAATPLPDEWRRLLVNYGGGIKTVGDLVRWLGTDDARIAQVREELAADFAAAKTELLQGQLDEKKAGLALKRRAFALYTAQLRAEKELRLAFPADKTLPSAYGGCIYAGLQMLQADYHAAFTARHPDTNDITHKRTALYNYLGYVTVYLERVGYLREEELLVQHDVGLHQHQQSIIRSQLAQAARMQMARHGLDGLVSFAEGGIAYDDVNAIVQLLQTALLGVIAGK